MQMASNDQQPTRRRFGPDWTLPGFSLFLGLVMWAAAWIGGHPMLGLAMFGIMVAFGAIFVVGRRSESIRLAFSVTLPAGQSWAGLGGTSVAA
jgi:Flp pilus assembly protein TadB